MKQKKIPLHRIALASALVLGAFTQAMQAQEYTNTRTGHLNLGFRQVTPFTANYEVVVDVGAATNFVNQAIGTTVGVTGYTASGQLAPDSFSGFTNLTWSAFGDVHTASGVPGYPVNTMWLTNPRSTFGSQTLPPARKSNGQQQTVSGQIESILNGATSISTRLGAMATLNTPTFVGEPLNTNNIIQGQNLSSYIGGSQNSADGTFKDNWYDVNEEPINVEQTTPGSFTSPQQSDLYEIRPNGNLDPHTLQTIGSAYYIGYFQLNTDGTMTFTRAASQPPAPKLTITRSGTTANISFTAAQGTVYTLFGTNVASLSSPITNWAVLGSTITGTGGTTNFVDTTADSDRVYRVGAH